MRQVAMQFGRPTSGTLKAADTGTIKLITSGEISTADVVTLEFEAGGFYLLVTKEWNASTYAYRGHHMFFIATPEQDLFGTVAVARVNAAASSNSGVTVSDIADSTVQIQRSSATYALRYALYRFGLAQGTGSSSTAEIPAYTGDYDVTPSLLTQTLNTNGKQMTDDVNVNPIPTDFGQVSQSGSVLTIE